MSLRASINRSVRGFGGFQCISQPFLYNTVVVCHFVIIIASVYSVEAGMLRLLHTHDSHWLSRYRIVLSPTSLTFFKSSLGMQCLFILSMLSFQMFAPPVSNGKNQPTTNLASSQFGGSGKEK